jgi:FKBP-type peptidyl-prolyl cis-trans isomerase 2
VKTSDLKKLIKEEIKKVLNEGSLRYLKDLEPGKEYQVTVKLKDPYGEKDMDTITISVNQEDIKKTNPFLTTSRTLNIEEQDLQ